MLLVQAKVQHDRWRHESGEKGSVDEPEAGHLGRKRQEVGQYEQRTLSSQALSHRLHQEVEHVGEQLTEIDTGLLGPAEHRLDDVRSVAVGQCHEGCHELCPEGGAMPEHQNVQVEGEQRAGESAMKAKGEMQRL